MLPKIPSVQKYIQKLLTNGNYLLLAEISDDEIKSHIDNDSIPDWNIIFKQFPVHTHDTERHVKLVTETPVEVC